MCFKIPVAYVLWLLTAGRDFSESEGTIFMDPSLVSLSHKLIQSAALWTPTFLKVNDKGVVGVGRHGRWQQFGRIF